MAYGDMADAVSGQPASSAEYNKVVDHVDDLDGRLDAAESTINNGTTGNAALGNRLGSGVTTGSTATAQLGTLTTNLGAEVTNRTNADTALSNKFGTGVGTDNTTGTASDTKTAGRQLQNLRTRLGTAESDILALDADAADLDTRVSAIESAPGGSTPVLLTVKRSTDVVMGGAVNTGRNIVFDAKDSDTLNIWTPSSNDYVTGLPDGKYEIVFGCCATGVTGTFGLYITKNGDAPASQYSLAAVEQGPGSTNSMAQVVCRVSIVSTDQIKARIYSDARATIKSGTYYGGTSLSFLKIG